MNVKGLKEFLNKLGPEYDNNRILMKIEDRYEDVFTAFVNDEEFENEYYGLIEQETVILYS